MIDCYLNFCRAIFTRYKGKVKYWLTFNEINSATTAIGAFLGQGILNEIKEMEFMDQVDVPQNRFQGLHHQFIASALAVKMAHEIDPNYQVGCMQIMATSYGLTCNPDDQIENPIFSYIDNSKSSATEIMAAYLKSLNLKIEPIIATIMLAGIEVDTNEFNIKTSPETFKTAAYLLELGANNIDKQNLLKENKENYCKRQDFIKKSYMINKNMALCVMDKNIYERYQLALISEDLLQFDDVEASFTIGFIDKNIIGISARSIGEIDVEAIMRSLGGGGHQTDAACTIESKKLEEVKQKLLQSIEVIK